MCSINACKPFAGLGLAISATIRFVAIWLSITSYSHSFCVWVGSLLTGGFSANQITVLALALDRLTAIARPFSYGQRKQANTPPNI
jgi:hypothetical protein